MIENKNYKMRLGLFVTLGFIIFAAAMYSIGSQQNLFSNNFRLNVAFKQVNGLQPGNNVRFSGINVGTVEDIELVDDSTVQVVLLIKEQVRQFIKSDATATIGSDGLMGNMLVNIESGNSQTERAVEDDGAIRSIEKIKTDDIINTLSNSNENLALLIEELLQITLDVNKGRGAVGTLMKDSLLATDIKSTVNNLKIVSRESIVAMSEVKAILLNFKNGEGLVNTLFSDTSYVGSLDKIMANLEASSQQIVQTSEHLNVLTQKIENSPSALNTVINDSTFNANLIQTMIEVKEGTAKFNEDMEALQHSWPFKKYFKKKEKGKD